MPGNRHTEKGGNCSSPQIWNQHIQLLVRNTCRRLITSPFNRISSHMGCCHGSLQEKTGSDRWRWRTGGSEGDGRWEGKKDGHVKGKEPTRWKSQHKWRSGCRWRSGQSSAPMLQEEIITVGRDWHDVDNNCPPAASASSAFLHSMYHMHVMNVFSCSQLSVFPLKLLSGVMVVNGNVSFFSFFLFSQMSVNLFKKFWDSKA